MTQSRVLADTPVTTIGTNTTNITANDVQLARGNNHGKNLIINGDFSVWQRGTSQTSSGYGSDDRWVNSNSGSTKVHTRQTFAAGSSIEGSPHYSRTVVTSVAGSSNYVQKTQKTESTRLTAGREVTFSFWAKADSAKDITVEHRQFFGTGGSPSSSVNKQAITTFSLTTDWVKYSQTFTFASDSGKTYGTDEGTDSTNVVFWFDAGSTFDDPSNSLGQQSGTFDISNVQLEFGDTATEFECVKPSEQLANCQRYFYRNESLVRQPLQCLSTTRAFGGNIQYPVTMRAAPSIVFDTASTYNLTTTGGGTQTVTATASTGTTSEAFAVDFDVASGLVAGNATLLLSNTGFGYEADAEL